MPRRLLSVICAIYGLPGLLSRDPWENKDAVGSDVMRALIAGNTQDRLMPNIVGHPIVQSRPPVPWVNGVFIHLFG